MENKNLYQKKRKFVEQLSLIIEENGRPRIAGQILGWLLVCSPPQQSFSDLVKHLNVSKASISNMTRMLIQSGLIEKVRLPDKRPVYFQIKNGAWCEVLQKQINLVHSLFDLSKKGLELMDDNPRLQEMHQFYKFSVEKLPPLIEQYRREHIN